MSHKDEETSATQDDDSGTNAETVDKTATRVMILNPSATISTQGLEVVPRSLDGAGNLGVYQTALQDKEQAQESNPLSTLDAIIRLGNLHSDQGKLMEAEEMYSLALRGREKALGAEHPLTLNTVNNLGNLYVDQGRLKQAEVMYERALRGYEKALGPEHMSTLDTINNLGNLYTS